MNHRDREAASSPCRTRSTPYSGQSLHAGFATSAATAGASELTIARQTRHRSLTVRTYIREGDLFKLNAATQIGL